MKNPAKTLRPLFTTLAQRYAERPGGYTRLLKAGNRVGDNAPLAVLELVDGPNDLKWETSARTVGREMAIRARQGGAGPDGWWALRRRVDKVLAGDKGETGALAELLDAPELEPLTRKNVAKSLAYRRVANAPSSEVVPISKFLDRCYHHYLSSLATFTLSTTPEPDSIARPLKQLTARLSPSEERGAPKPVLTVPLTGRRVRAGERTDGWAEVEGTSIDREPSKLGGPISRAKGTRNRVARRTLAVDSANSRTSNRSVEPTIQMEREAEAEVTA